MWPLDPDIAPIAHVGPDTGERWLVRDVARNELDAWMNAAAMLGWHLSDFWPIAEAEPPLQPEILRVCCSAQLPKPRKKRKPVAVKTDA